MNYKYFSSFIISIAVDKGGKWRGLELFSLQRGKVVSDLLKNSNQRQIRKKKKTLMCHSCVLWKRCSLELLQLLQIEKKAKRRMHNVCTAYTTAVHICTACATAVHNICTSCTTAVISAEHAQVQYTYACYAQLQCTHLHGKHKCSAQHLTACITAGHNICAACTTAVHICMACTAAGCSHQAIQQSASHLSRGQGSFKLLPFCFSDIVKVTAHKDIYP